MTDITLNSKMNFHRESSFQEIPDSKYSIDTIIINQFTYLRPKKKTHTGDDFFLIFTFLEDLKLSLDSQRYVVTDQQIYSYLFVDDDVDTNIKRKILMVDTNGATIKFISPIKRPFSLRYYLGSFNSYPEDRELFILKSHKFTTVLRNDPQEFSSPFNRIDLNQPNLYLFVGHDKSLIVSSSPVYSLDTNESTIVPTETKTLKRRHSTEQKREPLEVQGHFGSFDNRDTSCLVVTQQISSKFLQLFRCLCCCMASPTVKIKKTNVKGVTIERGSSVKVFY